MIDFKASVMSSIEKSFSSGTWTNKDLEGSSCKDVKYVKPHRYRPGSVEGPHLAVLKSFIIKLHHKPVYNKSRFFTFRSQVFKIFVGKFT